MGFYIYWVNLFLRCGHRVDYTMADNLIKRVDEFPPPIAILGRCIQRAVPIFASAVIINET